MTFLDNFLSSPAFLWVALRVVVTIVSTVFVSKIFRITWGKFSRDTIHQKAIKNIISGLIWLAGIILALSWIPEFGDTAATLIAGSGLVILAFGLAAQETLGNAFSGLFISMFKPFEVGDRINLVGMDIVGFVEDITLRHTVIRTLKNSRLIVPNSVINKELIENASFCNPRAANFIDVTITYGSDVAVACEIMKDVIGNHKDFSDNRTEEQKLTTPKVTVLVKDLGLYGVELRSSMWTETIANNAVACSQVRQQILGAFSEAGIKIASAKVMEVNLNQ